MSPIRRTAVVSLAVLLLTGCCRKHAGEVVGEDAPPPEEGFGQGALPLPDEGKELRDINFSFDSHTLSASAQHILDENAKWIESNADAHVTIEGHCDERGTSEYNLALGERRARAVESYLTRVGVSRSVLSTISYGEENPLDPSHNEAAWAKNRRAHFRVGH